jgi:signal transduction histidine kinase
MGLLLELPMSDIAKREEHDLLGVKLLPKSAYYGVQTARALDNFNMSGIQLHLYPDLINALAMVKLAAARANFECDLLVSSALRPPTTHVDVNCLLEHLEAIVSTIVGSDVTVQTTLGASESRVCAQRVDIERILLNLVFNAAAAMPSGGKLVIKTSVTEPDPNEVSTNPAAPFGDLHLTISDTGRGMSDRALASAINPLARPRPDGTGLGLACVTLIITRLGGTLGIESREDGGTVVSIALPLSPGRNQIH